jgi:methyl-accepting chemotaxis protein
MPSFGKTISGLQKLRTELEGVTKAAESTRGSVGGAKADIEGLSTAIEQNKARSEDFVARTQRTRDQAAQAKGDIDLLDKLYDASKETQNDFSEKFELFIEAVRLGAVDVNKFKQEMGDASIVIDGEFHRIRDLFSGADLGKYREQIQELIEGIQQNGVDLGEVIEFIDSRAGKLAKGLVNALRLFQQGKATLEDVQRALEAARDTFPPGTDLQGLINQLEQGLLSGDLQ